MTKSSPPITSERSFSDLWERCLELRPRVVDRDGNDYEVIFPGVRNPGPGPDFKGAVVRHRGRTIGGDVELHLEPSGWRAHRHHIDPAYNGVVLQVVIRDGRGPQRVSSPPTALASFSETDQGSKKVVSPDDLEARGLGRFASKSAGYLLKMDGGADPDQVVYEGLMEAMGYARNRAPFLALAKAVPVGRFRTLNGEPPDSAAFAVSAALLVAGGLVDTVDAGERDQVRRVARRMRVRRRLSPDAWSAFRVRPRNRPAARISGMARTIVRHVDEGLATGLRAEFEDRGTAGLVLSIRHRPHIGHDLARTVAANVLLPALHAWYTLRGGRGADGVVSAFRSMPAPPQDSVTRGMARAVSAPAPRTAAQHSGLHALARSASWPGSDA